MKDTHDLVEFNDLDLSDVYEIIGDECYFISSVVINNESPLLIRRFFKYVEEFALIEGYNTICLVAEPFKDKRLPYQQLISLYENISEESMLMYKHT